MGVEVVNMKIEGTFLGIERGCLTFSLTLNGDGLGCGFGGWSLGRAGSDLIREVLNVVGVEAWEELPGKYVRVRIEDQRSTAIGHITSNKWLNIAEWLEQWKAEHGGTE